MLFDQTSNNENLIFFMNLILTSKINLIFMLFVRGVRGWVLVGFDQTQNQTKYGTSVWVR